MILNENFDWRVKPVFILGEMASFLRPDGVGFFETSDEYKQEAVTGDILRRLNLVTEEKLLVRKAEELAQINVDVEILLVFIHTMDRFLSLIPLAEIGLPIILTGDDRAPGDALDSYQFLSDYDNVTVAYGFEKVREKIKEYRAAAYVQRAKVCVFDSGERKLEASSWFKNPLFNGMLNTEFIKMTDFEACYRNINPSDAESLAGNWMNRAVVKESRLEDVTRAAALFLAMKETINRMRANAAYVLWCAQFNKLVGGKMCLSIAKLNDAGYLTGCWRGENMLPMMLLHALSDRPVFFGEIHTIESDTISVRHCAVPASLATAPLVLRRWRDKEGTVTGFCDMPRGHVTLANSGTGDRLTLFEGEVVEAQDIGGSNCRTTVWVRVDDVNGVCCLQGREIAMAYGSHSQELGETCEILGIDLV
jgi:hypothetical protein